MKSLDAFLAGSEDNGPEREFLSPARKDYKDAQITTDEVHNALLSASQDNQNHH